MSIFINAVVGFVVMSAIYFIVPKLLEWWDSNHVSKWEKEAEKHMDKLKDEAIENIKRKNQA